MKTPLFSIIAPIYNVEPYLLTTLSSILSQTYWDFEVLAIDDGSTDGSSEILDEAAAKDSRIRVFHQKNSGVSAARNLGLDNARGEWIVFVDGDDALKINALEVLADCIRRNSTVDCISYGYEISEGIKTSDLTAVGSNSNFKTKERKYDCSNQVDFTLLNHYMVWTETFRKNILGELKFEPLKNGEDVLFCNGLAIKANKYISIGLSLYIYLQRSDSAKSNKWSLQRMEDFNALHNGILNNISICKKEVDPRWLKRWIGTLLFYIPEVSIFDKKTRNDYFKRHRALLKDVKRLPSIPKISKIWIRIATLFYSLPYFKIMAMMPMRFYSKFR